MKYWSFTFLISCVVATVLNNICSKYSVANGDTPLKSPLTWGVSARTETKKSRRASSAAAKLILRAKEQNFIFIFIFNYLFACWMIFDIFACFFFTLAQMIICAWWWRSFWYKTKFVALNAYNKSVPKTHILTTFSAAFGCQMAVL